MVKKSFKMDQQFLHIPVKSVSMEDSYYIYIEVDGVYKNEFLIAVCAPNEKFDFYVALDLRRYKGENITLSCDKNGAPENLFDAIIPGKDMAEEPNLYPDLYKETIRQQVHFSPKRGWLNDPNGLFYKDGVFNMYFQHNPFANHHMHTNVSWGHASSRDGVHFVEHNDVLMPKTSRHHIASGSAIVDKYNISGVGKDTVLATYTDLITVQYHGRPEVHSGGCHNLLYSTDNGMSFNYFDYNPIIPVPDNQHWRDPKILQIDEKTFCIAVFEVRDKKYCVSFYKSRDCKNWEWCSSDLDLIECPDIFLLEVIETGEKMWVLYGGNGVYRIGGFEDFKFKSNGDSGHIDYGDCVYAGQTFNNYFDDKCRIYTAWMRDKDHEWFFKEDEPNKAFGFSQSMALLTELSLHKTEDGYRLFRKPIKAIEDLRGAEKQIKLNAAIMVDAPCEIAFQCEKGEDISVYVGEAGFKYNATENRVLTSSGKTEKIYSSNKLNVRIIVDTRSVEMYINDQIAMSFFIDTKGKMLSTNNCDDIVANFYELKSIWQK